MSSRVVFMVVEQPLCGWLNNTYQDLCFVPVVAVLVLAGAEFIFFLVAHIVLCFEFVMKNLITHQCHSCHEIIVSMSSQQLGYWFGMFRADCVVIEKISFKMDGCNIACKMPERKFDSLNW